ncbi:major heat shock 70 kDa protein Bb [Purpureocillium lilacinum]|nr:major heat shock 70 kDa protein Bb [Purpureocillium lilacinum]
MANTTCTIGVDLGTTYSCVFANGKPVPIEYGDVQRSAVRVSRTNWTLVSASDIADAKRPHLTLWKRILGRGSEDGRLARDVESIPAAELSEHGARYKVHDQYVEAEEVAAFILGRIKAAVCNMYRGQPLERVVIAVPAHFTQRQRQATLDSAEVGGFDPAIVQLVEEPIAGAVDFVELDMQEHQKIRRLVVLDIGGGTTDASLLSFEALGEKHAYGVLATSGDNQLGGSDFDKALADLVLSKAGVDPEKVDRRRLMLECESKKRALSNADRVVVELSSLQDTDDLDPVEITRSMFEESSKPLHDSIRRILEDLVDQRQDAKNPDVILLIGGACAMPSVRDICKSIFGDASVRTNEPERSIARGAGRIASDPNIQINPVLPRSVGVEVYNTDGRLVMERIVQRNSPLPIRCAHSLSTFEENQAGVKFKLMEGEMDDGRLNIEVGCFEITGVRACPRGTPIEVQMEIMAPGSITMTAKIQRKKGKLTVKPTPRIERHHLDEWMRRTRQRLGLAPEEAATDGQENGHSNTLATESVQASGSATDRLAEDALTPSQHHSADKSQGDEAGRLVQNPTQDGAAVEEATSETRAAMADTEVDQKVKIRRVIIQRKMVTTPETTKAMRMLDQSTEVKLLKLARQLWKARQ